MGAEQIAAVPKLISVCSCGDCKKTEESNEALKNNVARLLTYATCGRAKDAKQIKNKIKEFQSDNGKQICYQIKQMATAAGTKAWRLKCLLVLRICAHIDRLSVHMYICTYI